MAKDYKIFGKAVASKERADLYYSAVNTINKKLGLPDVETGKVTPPDPDYPVISDDEEDVTKKYDKYGQVKDIKDLYGAWFQNNETIKASGTHYVMTGFIPVQAGEKYKLNACVNPTVPCVVGFTIAGNDTSAFDINTFNLNTDVIVGSEAVSILTGYNIKGEYNGGYIKDYIFTIPEGFTHIRVSAKSKTNTDNKKEVELSVKKLIGDITVLIPEGQTDVTKKYNISGEEFAQSYSNDRLYHNYFGEDCSLQNPQPPADSTWNDMTGYIPVKKGDVYRISGNVHPKYPAVVGYTGTGDTATKKALVNPSTFDTSKAITGYKLYDENTAIFDGYVFSIGDGISFIRFAARGIAHNYNASKKEIQIIRVKEGVSNSEPGQEAPEVSEPVYAETLVDVAFSYDNQGRKLIPTSTEGVYLIEGTETRVSKDDVKYLWYLNINDKNAGAIHKSTNDKCHTTGYIPIRDEDGNLLYDNVKYSGFPVPNFDICVGFSEIESGTKNAEYIEANRQSYKTSEYIESFKDNVRYEVMLDLTKLRSNINYLRFCSFFVNKPKGTENDESTWNYLSDMNVIFYDNSDIDYAGFERPEKTKSIQSQILDRVAANIESSFGLVNTFQLLKEPVRNYIDYVQYDNLNRTSKISAYLNYDEAYDVDDLDKPNTLTLPEEGIIYLSDLPDVSRYSTSSVTRIAQFNFIPNKRYYWQKQYKESYINSIDVLGARRFIDAGTTKNVRDLGGIKCSCGNSIKFDKIFRGSAIDNSGFSKINELGITAELDLRNVGEGYDELNFSFITSYAKIPLVSFTNLYTISASLKANIKNAFEFVANSVKANKKVYIHCAIGCHRVGLLSAIIEGVLGAHQSEIDKDYELSSFSKLASTTIEDADYVAAYNSIQNYYDGSWTNFLLDCGVPYERIVEFRNNMLVYPNKEQIVQYHTVTYNQLVNLKNNKELIPGDKYRMIDYDTEVYQLGHFIGCSGVLDDLPANSAYHRFDLLLTALSTSELDCNVKALHSVRDTEGYFAQTDLSKWELKYDLDNDKTKYNWAVEGGKGVIYYMKDENNNELPYDFKNVLFSKNDIDMHTFNYNSITHTLSSVVAESEAVSVEDVSTDDVNKFRITGTVGGSFANISSTSRYVKVKNNDESYVIINGVVMAPDDTAICNVIGGHLYSNESSHLIDITISEVVEYPDAQASNVVIKPYLIDNVQYLNNIVFITEDANDKITDCFVDVNSHDNSFIGDAINVTVGKYCSQNEIENAENFVLKDNCNKINIKNSAKNTTIGKDCYQITITNNATALIVADYVSDKTATTTENTYVSVPNGISFVTVSE